MAKRTHIKAIIKHDNRTHEITRGTVNPDQLKYGWMVLEPTGEIVKFGFSSRTAPGTDARYLLNNFKGRIYRFAATEPHKPAKKPSNKKAGKTWRIWEQGTSPAGEKGTPRSMTISKRKNFTEADAKQAVAELTSRHGNRRPDQWHYTYAAITIVEAKARMQAFEEGEMQKAAKVAQAKAERLQAKADQLAGQTLIDTCNAMGDEHAAKLR